MPNKKVNNDAICCYLGYNKTNQTLPPWLAVWHLGWQSGTKFFMFIRKWLAVDFCHTKAIYDLSKSMRGSKKNTQICVTSFTNDLQNIIYFLCQVSIFVRSGSSKRVRRD